MATDVMLRDRWFAAPDTFSRNADATQVLVATDLVIADTYEAQLLEVDGLHYSGLSLRGARLVPPPRPEDYIDDDEDEVLARNEDEVLARSASSIPAEASNAGEGSLMQERNTDSSIRWPFGAPPTPPTSWLMRLHGRLERWLLRQMTKR